MTRQRANGESSIYRDEDGRWHGYVSLGLKDNGRRDRRHVSGERARTSPQRSVSWSGNATVQ